MAFKYKGLRLKDPSLLKRLKRVPNIFFQRLSVAYDYYGNPISPNNPRFGFGGVEGILIEEAHTNIMPATESQSLTTPYTTGTLNGTYTFMIQGSGEITLSGGATGIVTPGTPVTSAVSSDTVTLTPTGTVTLVQILNKAYPLSWTLGGTTQALEILRVPSNTINLSSGSIELEITPGQSTGTCFIFQMTPGTGANHVDSYTTAKKIYYRTVDKDGNVSSITGSTLTSNQNYVVGMSWRAEKLTGYLSGAVDSTPIVNPKLPTSKYVAGVNIGSSSASVTQFNGYIKNLVISRYGRDNSNMIRRAKENINSQCFLVDKDVSIIFPLKNNLQAYRMVTT